MKNIFKEIWFLCFGILTIFSLNFSSVVWLCIHSDCGESDKQVETPKIDNQELDGDTDKWISRFDSLINWIIHPSNDYKYDSKLKNVTSLIQITINRLLWILSLVALVYVLYCGFSIFSAWSDDGKVKKWKKWLTTAAIAIAWIWLSWLIVSLMLWFINILTQNQG